MGPIITFVVLGIIILVIIAVVVVVVVVIITDKCYNISI